MTTGSDDEGRGMEARDDEALWTLLGRQAPPAKASPYFARRVLREIAMDEERRGGWWSRLRRIWTLTPWHAAAWSGAVVLGVLCLSAALTMPANHPALVRPVAAAARSTSVSVVPTAVPAVAPVEEVAPVPDAELIADLDNLLSREESRLWTEEDTARF